MRPLTRPAGRLALLAACSWPGAPVAPRPGGGSRSGARRCAPSLSIPSRRAPSTAGPRAATSTSRETPARPGSALNSGPAFPGFYVTGLVADPAVRGRLWASLAGELGGGLLVTQRRPRRDLDGPPQGRTQHRPGARTRARARASRGCSRPAATTASACRRTAARPGRGRARASPGSSRSSRSPSTRRTAGRSTRARGGRRSGRGTAAHPGAASPTDMVLDATVYAWDFDGGRHARHLGLDVRVGLPLARRRRPLDALHERIHEPPLARRAARSDAARSRLRRDGRRASTARTTAA